MDRNEHVEWCKARAREYLGDGKYAEAVASMISDMGERDDTRVNEFLAGVGLIAAMNNDFGSVKAFIEGFN